jgi:lipopolysaccharide transport system permease protein
MTEDTAHTECVINSSQSLKSYLYNLIAYRELLYFFVWRDLLVRYKQAFFGISWALVRPLLNMCVFAFVFGRIAQFSAHHVNYGLFVLSATLPWQYFASAVVDATHSLVNHSHLISKAFFPRILIPLSQVFVNLVDLAVTAVVLFLWSFITGDLNPWIPLTFPCVVLFATLLISGVSLWLSALTVKYRDFKIVVPFLVQFGMFVSPVGYGTFVIPEKWQWLFCLNPLVGLIDSFRWAFLGVTYSGIIYSIGCSIVLTLGILISGLIYFRNMDRSFADEI